MLFVQTHCFFLSILLRALSIWVVDTFLLLSKDDDSIEIVEGYIQFWLDIWSMYEASLNPLIKIALPPIEQWQLRIIIWKAEKCAIKDLVTRQNDLYVRVTPQIAAKVNNPLKRKT